MPEVVVHAVFGREVRKHLDSGIAGKIREVPYTFALFGPDIWFMYEPWKRREGRGRRMHTTKTGAFLMQLARQEKLRIGFFTVVMAPIAEELMFRGAVFGGLRPYGRTLAYAVSMLLFSVYHVWGYALQDPVYWIYLLQYLPVSWLLCRCYERCDSIWGSILFHALVNAVSVRVLTALA